MTSLLSRMAATVLVLAGLSLVAAPTHAATPRSTLSVSDSTVVVGDEVKFTGKLASRVKSQKYVLQVRLNGAWRTFERGYSKRLGKVVVDAAVLDYAAGSYAFRLVGKPNRYTGAKATTSRSVTVRIDNRPGSMQLPWRPGQTFAVEDWTFLFGATDTDAYPELRAESTYQETPPPGYNFITVPLSFRRTGSGPGNAWAENSLKFVGSDGVVYGPFTQVGSEEYSCYLDTDWTDAPELYTGAAAQGSDCVLVPASAIAGGRWRLTGGFDGPEQFITIN